MLNSPTLNRLAAVVLLIAVWVAGYDTGRTNTLQTITPTTTRNK